MYESIDKLKKNRGLLQETTHNFYKLIVVIINKYIYIFLMNYFSRSVSL